MTQTIHRWLNIELPKGQSAFLSGPRKTGKTTFLKATFPGSLMYDMLQTDLYLEFIKRPFLLREQLLSADPYQLRAPVIIDEVQKTPPLLDEIHWLIENKGLRFILCGSSARKLKRGKANLLGGRAWRYEMHPLVSAEVDDLNLLRALNRGMIPMHYLQEEYRKSLQAYVGDYLKEEVFEEGLTRNIPAFLTVLRCDGVLPRRTDELCEHCPGLRCRFEDGQRILPDPCGHTAGHDDRAIQKTAGSPGDYKGR